MIVMDLLLLYLIVSVVVSAFVVVCADDIRRGRGGR
jgi:hypothetical protein